MAPDLPSRPPHGTGQGGGSRFLYEPFQYPSERLREAQDKVLQMQFAGIEGRLNRIESSMARLEKRLWLTVYGVAATILAQGARALMMHMPSGGF